MRKIIWAISIFAGTFQTFAQGIKLAPEQEHKVRTLISDYYNLLQQWADNPNSDFDNKIYSLFYLEEGAKVFDDLKTDKMTALNTYLGRYFELKDEKIQTTILSDIQKVSIVSFEDEAVSKSMKEAKVAVTVLSKQVDIRNKAKKVANTFVIPLKEGKISTIKNAKSIDEFLATLDTLDDTSVAEANTGITYSVLANWYTQGILLCHAKHYEDALRMFERAALRGHLESQYQAGVLYFLKKGCKNLNKKEREKRGYDWLTKAAAQMPEGSRYNKARQTLDALGYY